MTDDSKNNNEEKQNEVPHIALHNNLLKLEDKITSMRAIIKMIINMEEYITQNRLSLEYELTQDYTDKINLLFLIINQLGKDGLMLLSRLIIVTNRIRDGIIKKDTVRLNLGINSLQILMKEELSDYDSTYEKLTDILQIMIGNNEKIKYSIFFNHISVLLKTVKSGTVRGDISDNIILIDLIIDIAKKNEESLKEVISIVTKFQKLTHKEKGYSCNIM